MTTLKTANWVVLMLLGVASGIAKMLLMEQEVAFFHREMGISLYLVMALGVVQFTGGLLLILRASRPTGAAMLALTFLISAVLIFMAARPAFGLVSLLPVAMAVFAAADALRSERERGARPTETPP